MKGLTSPLTPVLREAEGRAVRLYMRGGAELTGTIAEVYDDGEMLRLDDDGTRLFVDIAYIDALKVVA